MTEAPPPPETLSAVSTMRRNFWSGVWRVMKRKPSRLFGAVVLLLFALMGLIGKYLYPRPLPRDSGNILGPPTLRQPFGTDFQGTDVLALLVVGTRYVLLTALIAAVVGIVIGTTIGLVAGFKRGWLDSVLMRLTDINLTIPDLPLLLVLSTIWKFSSAWEMGLVLGLLGWGGVARAVRSQTLSLRERGFVEAARGLGLSAPHIVFRELLPPIAPYIAMNAMIRVVGGVYSQVGLFFLGVMPVIGENWGVMLNRAVFDYGAMTNPSALPWMLAPLLAILLLTLAIVLVVDAMDEIFNPRLRTE